MKHDIKHFIKLETALHQYEVRSDVTQLKKLIHPEFKEVGYSGLTFDYQSTIEDVPKETKPEYEVWSQDYQMTALSEDIIQLFYLEARLSSSGELSRFAKRTSIWQNTIDGWQMRYHQGTPTAPFKKV